MSNRRANRTSRSRSEKALKNAPTPPPSERKEFDIGPRLFLMSALLLATVIVLWVSLGVWLDGAFHSTPGQSRIERLIWVMGHIFSDDGSSAPPPPAPPLPRRLTPLPKSPTSGKELWNRAHDPT